MDLGNAIKQIRKHRKLSQTELASMCGLSTNAICSIEKNSSFPAKSTFDKICKALDIPSACIFLFAITDEDIPESKRAIYKGFFEKNLKEMVLAERE